MIIDEFQGFTTGLTSPAVRIEEIVPNDNDDLTYTTRAINVATEGTVKVTTTAGVISDVYMAPGVIFPIRAVRVWADGTTATGIRGLS